MSRKERKILWQPHEGKQTAFLEYEDVDEKLFGGGRGGGKTDAGQVWMVHPEYLKNPKYRGLVIRKRATDLSDWMDRARRMYAPLGAVFTGSPGKIEFPSGARILGGHLGDKDSYTKYQGHEYQRMLFEELTHIASEDQYERLIASCRSTVPELKPRIAATTNSDGDGRIWVKKRFRIMPGGKVQHYRDDNGRLFMYVPSTIDDNPTLANDPNYTRFLDSIKDPDLRQAWRFGDWEVFSVKGAYYASLFADMKKSGRIGNVPHHRGTRVDTFWDLGWNDTMVCLFTQRVGREDRLIDVYEMANQDIAHYAEMLDRKPYVYGVHHLPHDAAKHELGTGKTIKEVFQTLLPKQSFEIVPMLPLQDGINQVRMRLSNLWIDQTKCSRVIEAGEIYRREWLEDLQTFRDQPVHDWSSHIMDALRYWAVTEPSQGIFMPPPSQNDLMAPI